MMIKEFQVDGGKYFAFILCRSRISIHFLIHRLKKRENFLASQNSGEILHSWSSFFCTGYLYFWRYLSCRNKNEKRGSQVEIQECALKEGYSELSSQSCQDSTFWDDRWNWRQGRKSSFWLPAIRYNSHIYPNAHTCLLIPKKGSVTSMLSEICVVGSLRRLILNVGF